MRSSLRGLAPFVLLVGLACQPQVAPPIYGPWEEGLTLVFENPSLPQPRRSEERQQLRVARSAMAPGSPGLVQLDFTSLQGRMSVFANHHAGGIELVDDRGQVLAVALPAHFPDTTSWVDHGIKCHVLGRAAWGGAAILPPTADPIGIWVEAQPSQGPRRRALYLPNLGAVETREERNGTWVVVSRLVARGFTDPPSFKRP